MPVRVLIVGGGFGGLAAATELVQLAGNRIAVSLVAFIPRAGIFAEGQARIVARNLATQVAGGRDLARFDGTGYCFLETGGGRALRVDGDFFAEPSPTATLDAAPSPENLQAKEAFETKRIRAWFAT